MSQNINITINLSSDEEGIHVSVSSYVQPDQFDAQSMKECLHQAVDMAMARFEPSREMKDLFGVDVEKVYDD